MPKSQSPCGTNAKYQWHLKHEGSPVECEPCLVAAAQYQSEWRAANPDKAKNASRKGNARQRAFARLAGRHRRDFQAYYREELKKEGIT